MSSSNRPNIFQDELENRKRGIKTPSSTPKNESSRSSFLWITLLVLGLLSGVFCILVFSFGGGAEFWIFLAASAVLILSAVILASSSTKKPVVASAPVSAPVEKNTVGKFEELERLLKTGLITQTEFEAKRQEILNRM